MAAVSQRKQFATVLSIVFFGFLGVSIPYLIFPALFVNPEYSILPSSWPFAYHALFLGITLAAYPFGQFLGSPILGALSDDYGRKPLLSGSLVVAAMCNLLTGFALTGRILWLIVLSRLVAGFMEGNIAIARAMAADMKGLSKHGTFGKINAAASIAYFIGPFLGGILAEVTIATPFYMIGILFGVLAILSMLLLESGVVASGEKKGFLVRINVIGQLARLFRNKRLQFLVIVSTCFTLAIDMFYEFGPVYLTMKWELCPSKLIIYNSVLCATLAIGNGWLPTYISKRYSTRYWIIGAMSGLALLLIGMVITNSPPLMVVLFGLSGFFIGSGVTLLMVKVSDSSADSIQGEVMGTLLSLRVLGDAIICLLGGVLILFSPKIILVLAAFLSLSTMFYFKKTALR